MRGPADAALAARLRELKDHCGISCRQLGEAIGVSNAAAYRYLDGKIHVPADRLPLMARAFGCAIGDLFARVGSPLPKAVRRSARRRRDETSTLSRSEAAAGTPAADAGSP